MDKASAYGAGDCRFESCRVHWCRWHTCHQTRFDRFSYDYSPTPAMSWCFVVAKRKICPHSGSNLHASRCRNRNSYLIVYAPGSRQPGPEKKNVNRSKPRHFVNSSEPEKNNNNNLPWNWQTQLYMNMNDITLQTHCYLIAGERNNYYLQLHIAQKQKPYLDICPIWQTHYPSHARLRSLIGPMEIPTIIHMQTCSVSSGLLHLSRICNIVPERSILHQSYSRSMRRQ